MWWKCFPWCKGATNESVQSAESSQSAGLHGISAAFSLNHSLSAHQCTFSSQRLARVNRKLDADPLDVCVMEAKLLQLGVQFRNPVQMWYSTLRTLGVVFARFNRTYSSWQEVTQGHMYILYIYILTEIMTTHNFYIWIFDVMCPQASHVRHGSHISSRKTVVHADMLTQTGHNIWERDEKYKTEGNISL